MRITNNTIMRGFSRDFNRIGTFKNDSMGRIMSGRKFSRASESPLNAAKALNVRKSLYYSDQYMENLKVADKFYTEAETSLLGASEKLQEIREMLVEACNSGIRSIDEYNIYAQQLDIFATQLCEIFNTDSAGRAIFGGSSDDGLPFRITYDASGYGIVTYHNVPVNAYDSYLNFPYSSEILADIGLGLSVNQKTHEIDPQTGLRISFNGPEVSGCGTDGGIADIDMSSIKQGKEYSIDVYTDNVRKTIVFKGGANYAETAANIQEELNKQFMKSHITFEVSEQGVITNATSGSTVSIINSKDAANNLEYTNNYGYSKRFKINLEELEPAKEYSINVIVGDEAKIVTFTSAELDRDAYPDEESYLKDLAAANQQLIQDALTNAFGTDDKGNLIVHIAEDGSVTSEGNNVMLNAAVTDADAEVPSFERKMSFSNNYIQLTLDAAAALRYGDIDYANACIDKVVKANESLLVEIANLGANEDFISFSLDRMTTREYNLFDRQEELEAADLEEETTLLKTYTAMYNACLQLATEVVPMSIFSYMR